MAVMARRAVVITFFIALFYVDFLSCVSDCTLSAIRQLDDELLSGTKTLALVNSELPAGIAPVEGECGG